MILNTWNTAWAADLESSFVPTSEIISAIEAGWNGDELPEYDFILPGGVAGDVGLIAGGGNLGKSWMAIQMSISMAVGSDIFGLFSGVPENAGWTLKKQKVAYVTLEDDSDTVKRRLHSIFRFLKKNKDKPPFSNIDIDAAKALIAENFKVVDMSGKGEKAYVSGQGMSAEDRDMIVDGITEKFKGFNLLIFDTLRRTNSHDENDNVGANLTLSQFDQIAANLGCMILLLTHVTKESSLGGDTVIEAVRGSSVWANNARFGAVLAPVGQQKDAKGRRVRVDEYLRRHFVRLAIPKANKIAPISEIWLHRSSTGVLCKTDIDVDAAIQLSINNPDLAFADEAGIRNALKIASNKPFRAPHSEPKTTKATKSNNTPGVMK